MSIKKSVLDLLKTQLIGKKVKLWKTLVERYHKDVDLRNEYLHYTTKQILPKETRYLKVTVMSQQELLLEIKDVVFHTEEDETEMQLFFGDDLNVFYGLEEEIELFK